MSVPLSLLSGVRNLLETLTPGVRPGNATPHEMQNGCSFIGDHRYMEKKIISEIITGPVQFREGQLFNLRCVFAWDTFISSVEVNPLSPSDAFDARLFDGKSHADANFIWKIRCWASRPADKGYRTPCGKNGWYFMCFLCMYIYIYVYVVGTSKEWPRGMVMLGL